MESGQHLCGTVELAQEKQGVSTHKPERSSEERTSEGVLDPNRAPPHLVILVLVNEDHSPCSFLYMPPSYLSPLRLALPYDPPSSPQPRSVGCLGASACFPTEIAKLFTNYTSRVDR
jgi:hypothetical protein